MSWRIDRLVNCLIDRYVSCLIDSLVSCLIDSLVSCLIDRLVGHYRVQRTSGPDVALKIYKWNAVIYCVMIGLSWTLIIVLQDELKNGFL